MEYFNLLNISRHRMTVDGHGVTTLVALKGCPLSCKYCLNKMVLKQDARLVTVEKLLDKVMIDYCYFVATGGGVTFGGGESLLHHSAIKEFYSLLPSGVNINVETCLNVPQSFVEDIVDIISEWIIDIKDIDKDVYKSYTHLSNDQVLSNLKYLADKGIQDKCLIRIPNIPKFNTKDNIEKSVKYVSELGFKNIDCFEYIIREEK